MSRLSRGSPWWGFGALALTGLVLVSVSLVSLRNYRASNDATIEAASVVLDEAVLFIYLHEAQSEKRGYLATGNEAFRASFLETKALLIAQMDKLDRHAGWTADQRDALNGALAAAREQVDLLQHSIDLMDAGLVEEARASADFERDKQLVGRVQDGLGGVAAVETAQQRAAEADADERALVSAVAIVALAVVTTSLGIWVFLALRRRGEAETLRRSNQAKDEVLAMLAHELRSPITVIGGNARILRTRFDSLDEDERLASVAEVEREAERIERMVAQMMTLAGDESSKTPELEPTRIPDVITRAAERTHLLHPDAEVAVNCDAGLNLVLASASITEQVIENLLSNAIKHGPAGQPIEVRARNRGQSVEVSVIDRGVGIQAELRERIFEPFVRLPGTNGRQDGLGLGLAVCRRLMRVQGGDIWVDGGPGRGTCFTLSLPIITAPPTL